MTTDAFNYEVMLQATSLCGRELVHGETGVHTSVYVCGAIIQVCTALNGHTRTHSKEPSTGSGLGAKKYLEYKTHSKLFNFCYY